MKTLVRQKRPKTSIELRMLLRAQMRDDISAAVQAGTKTLSEAIA